MGWAHCGNDTEGRLIGYAIEALCDHPGCTKEIDRGLDFACGGMHGELDHACEKYFCWDHRFFIAVDCIAEESGGYVCDKCLQLWENEHFPECKECRMANGVVGECDYCALKNRRSWLRESRGNGVDYIECDVCPHIEVFPDEDC